MWEFSKQMLLKIFLGKSVEKMKFGCSKWNSDSGVNFTNVLQAAFMLSDPESTKKLLDLTVFFYAFGICAFKSCS